MKVGRIKHSITFLFLALFLTTKMAGMHMLFHTNDHNHAVYCSICDYAITNDLTPAITPDLQDFDFAENETIIQREITKSYDFIISSTIATNQLFSRPPPFLL